MATNNWNMKPKNIIYNNSYVIWSYKTWRILIIYFNPIKNLILILVKENRLVDLYIVNKFYIFQSTLFVYKKNVQTCKEI